MANVYLNNIENYLSNSENFTFSIEEVTDSLTTANVQYAYIINSTEDTTGLVFSNYNTPLKIVKVTQQDNSFSYLVIGNATGFGTNNAKIGQYFHLSVKINNSEPYIVTSQIVQQQIVTYYGSPRIDRIISPNVSPQLVILPESNEDVILKIRILDNIGNSLSSNLYSKWLGDKNTRTTFSARYMPTGLFPPFPDGVAESITDYIYFRFQGTIATGNLQATYMDPSDEQFSSDYWFDLDKSADDSYEITVSNQYYYYSSPTTTSPVPTMNSKSSNSIDLQFRIGESVSAVIYIYNGSTWQVVNNTSKVFIYNGSAWQNIATLYVYKDGTWNEILSNS